MLPSTLDMVPAPSTWNPRPSTVHKKIDSMVSCNVSCWAQLVSVFLRDVEFSQMVIYRLFC